MLTRHIEREGREEDGVGLDNESVHVVGMIEVRDCL